VDIVDYHANPAQVAGRLRRNTGTDLGGEERRPGAVVPWLFRSPASHTPW
jgi:hypothetical protein